MVIAQLLALIRATCTPGARRRASGTLVTPERGICSWVMTKTAVAVSTSACSFFPAEMTFTCINCSLLISPRSGSGCCPEQGAGNRNASNQQAIQGLARHADLLAKRAPMFLPTVHE